MHPARLAQSTGFRLVAWYAAVFGASVAILLGIVYWIGANAVQQQLEDSVASELRLLVSVYETRGRDALVRAVQRRTSRLVSPRRYYLLQRADGTPIAGNLPHVPPVEALMVMSVPEHESGQHPATHEEVSTQSMLAQGRWLSGGEYLLVGESRYRLVKAKEAIVAAVGWGMPLTVLLALGGGLVLAASYLRRIDAVNRTLGLIMEGDLARRVPHGGSSDEMDQLARNLNAMLDRIQSLMESVKRVSDDLAHDLRTPLSRLRQRLERARADPGGVTCYDEVLERSVADVDAILETFDALLRIAQVEAGTRRSAFAAVDLTQLAGSVAEIYAPVAEDRGQHLGASIADEVRVHGDRELLLQMLSNLVENAIQHTPRGASIRVALERDGECALLRVADTGPGIPHSERGNVFRRFYRLETSRTTPGNGLGLALVKAVADLHEAPIELEDNEPGLRVTVRFPTCERTGQTRTITSGTLAVAR